MESDERSGVTFTNNKYIKKLNFKYRNKNQSTDILSFPLHEAISPGNLPKPLTPEHQNLGDLIISIPYVINWCKRNNKYYTTCHSFKKTKRCLNIEKRLIELYVHGVLHLLGYDHESDDDYLMMNMKEKEMLKQFWKWKKDSRNRK
ncbi:17919_t:CDS:2 [Entrophospora sp. SA101]|nr:17919_t:CDS:2 [Entrophospora sp. SA101]